VLMRALVLSLVVISSAGAVGAAAQTATTPLPAPAVSSPAAVVRELYKIHRNGYGPLFEKKGRKYHEKFFDRKLADLIWKDLTETPEGEVGHIDFDPLFNAQDTQIRNFRVGEAAVRGDAATVPVTFDNFDKKEKIDFILVRTKAGWKISNIVYGTDSNFLKILSEPM
jgi:Protein of unknown function (DUF3828)